MMTKKVATQWGIWLCTQKSIATGTKQIKWENV